MGRHREKHREISTCHILTEDVEYVKRRRLRGTEPLWRTFSRIIGEYRTGDIAAISHVKDLLQQELHDATLKIDKLEKELEALELEKQTVNSLERYI